MSLTVPRAGLSAGRAAQIRVAVPQIGDAIADLGQLVQEKGAAMQLAQQKIDVQRTQLDMTRDLGAARLEMEQYSDPEALDRDWPTRVEEIKAKYLGPGEDGAPRWDAETSAALDLGFTELKDRHALALGEKAIGLRQSQQEAAWVNMQADIGGKAVTADPETLEAYIELGEAAIDERLARGTISAEDAAKEKLSFREGIFAGRADQQIAADPEAFLAASAAGEYGMLGPQGLAIRNVAAQQEIDRRAAAAAKEAEIQQKSRQTAIGKRLDEMTGLMAGGFKVADEGFLTDPEVTAHPDFPAARAAQSLRDELPGIRMLTVAELDAQISSEMARPVAHEYQTERVKVLKAWRDEAALRANTDYVEMAREGGIAVPDLPAFDPEDPAPFAQGLMQRLSFDGWARDKGHTQTQAVVSQAERAQLKTVLDPKAEPGPKVALAKSMLAASGGKIDRLSGVLELDPVFSRASRVMAMTGNSDLAEEMLRGQQKEVMGTVSLPTDKVMTALFDEVTGGAFDGNPKAKAEMLAATRALYADAATSIDPEEAAAAGFDDGEAELFSASVQRVLGASPDPNGQLTIGGLQEVNDAKVYLPPGVPVAQVEDAIDVLSDQLRGKVRMDLYGTRSYGWDETQPDVDRLRSFKAASIDGSAPDMGADPGARFDTVTLHRVGESGIYEMRYSHNGRSYTIPRAGDDQRRAWRFNLSDLLREAAK